jgi:hypothetical protein
MYDQNGNYEIVPLDEAVISIANQSWWRDKPVITAWGLTISSELKYAKYATLARKILPVEKALSTRASE